MPQECEAAALVSGQLSSISLNDVERDMCQLEQNSLDNALALFRRNGYLRVENLFSSVDMEKWSAFYRRRYHSQLQDTRQEDRRPLYTVGIEGSLNDPQLYANPLIVPILRALLGEEYILGAMSTVISFPGAPDQFVHRDSQAIFEKDYSVDVTLPTYALTMLIPLVACTEETGCTKVRPATHLLDSHTQASQPDWVNPEVNVGSVMLTDSRVIHRGGANTSDKIRPLIYLTFHRKWYRDFWGYETRPPVSISNREFQKMPMAHRNLVAWTRDPYRWIKVKSFLSSLFPASARRLLKRALGK